MSNVKNKRVAVLVENSTRIWSSGIPSSGFVKPAARSRSSAPRRARLTHPSTATPPSPTFAASEVKASDFDAIIIPGGYSPDHMRRHPRNGRPRHPGRPAGQGPGLDLPRPLDALLGQCLKGRKMTGFFAIRDDVENAGGIWQDAACVRDGNLVTSRTPDDLPAFMQGIFAALEEVK